MIVDDIPPERDLPAGRLAQLKGQLMAQIDTTPQTQPPPPATATPRSWRRVALVAAGVVAALGITTTLVLGDDGRASANTAVLRPDGSILISINEGKDPEALQRRLVDLGVPAVVDFLDSGFGCDPARSTGWVLDPPGEELFGWDPASPDEASRFVLHPDQLGPGETAVFEFQIDEHGDRVAANVNLRLSTSEVGPCEPVPNASIVDAEGGVAGG